MKNRRKYLLAALLLLVGVLLYLLRDWAKKNPHAFIDTVMAEDEAIMASADDTSSLIASDSEKSITHSSDSSMVHEVSADNSSLGRAAIVLFEKEESEAVSQLQQLPLNPTAEFEKLKELKATPYSKLRSGGKTPDGWDIIYPGDNIEDQLATGGFYADKSNSVYMWLAVDSDTGVIEEISCLNIKGKVYFYKDQDDGFEVRYDGLKNLGVMVKSEYYLKLRQNDGAYALEGNIYSINGEPKQLSELLMIETRVQYNKMDMNKCIAKD